MIRIEEPTGWILISHPDHARLAGQMAAHWGNAEFAAPEPRADVLVAVLRHDDAWGRRDAQPKITRAGLPAAFSRELVGAYSAFEEIDLADYLAVRGRAASLVAADNPYAGLIISMHTVDLLTHRADYSALSPADRQLLERFIAEQRAWQERLVAEVAARPEWTQAATGAPRQRAFEFLQACDSLSLTICVRYPQPIPLRHRHPDRQGQLQTITCTPRGNDVYALAPYPFDRDDLTFHLPCRRIPVREFSDQASFDAAWQKSPGELLTVRLVRAEGT